MTVLALSWTHVNTLELEQAWTVICTCLYYLCNSTWGFTICPSQLRDCELAPGVNRDLARRVRNINGITQHKQVLRNDIKLAAKLIHTLDEKGDLWSSKFQEEGQSAEVKRRSHSLTCLRSISTDYCSAAAFMDSCAVSDFIFEVTCSESHPEEYHRLPDRGGQCWGGGTPRLREWDGSWGERQGGTPHRDDCGEGW